MSDEVLSESQSAVRNDDNDYAWFTFTFRLPFGLGLGFDARDSHTIVLDPDMFVGNGKSAWADPSAEYAFGTYPIVRLKFYQQPIRGVEMAPSGFDEVGEAIYGEPFIGGDNASLPYFGENSGMYAQWVSLETQAPWLVWESAEDAAHCFHRCLSALNQFLAAYILAFGERSTSIVTALDIGRMVFCGAFDTEDNWRPLAPLMMHPESIDPPVGPVDMNRHQYKFSEALESVLYRHPYMPAKLWRWRAWAAHRRGDTVDRVISLQTSVESLLYATWRMILVDKHNTVAEIRSIVDAYVPYEKLIGDTMPGLIGGSWDRTNPSSPVSSYWNDLYMLRNSVVHSAYIPTPRESDQAEEGYQSIRKHVADRVWKNRYRYPRTMLARIGNPEAAGYPVNARIQQVMQSLRNEGYTWWVPDDLAGREPA